MPSLDTQLALAHAEELIAAAMRLLHTHAGEHVAILIGTQLVEDYARRAVHESAVYEAREVTKH